MNGTANSLSTRPRLLTIMEAAAILAISKRTLERLIAGGEFASPLKIGRSSRVAAEDVDAYLARLQKRRLAQGLNP